MPKIPGGFPSKPPAPSLPPQPEGYPYIDPSTAVILGSPEAQAIMGEQLSQEQLEQQEKMQKLQKAMQKAASEQAEAQEKIREYDRSRRGPAPEHVWIERKGEDEAVSDVYVIPERRITVVNGKVVPGIDYRFHRPKDPETTPQPEAGQVGVIEVMPRGMGLTGLARHLAQRSLRRNQNSYNRNIEASAIEREAAAALVKRRGFKPELRPTTRKQGDVVRDVIKHRVAGREALLEQWRLSSFAGSREGPDASTGTEYITKYSTNQDGSYNTDDEGNLIEEPLLNRQGRKIALNDLGTDRQLQRLKPDQSSKGPRYRYSRSEMKQEIRLGKEFLKAEQEIAHARHEIHSAAYDIKPPSNTKRLSKRQRLVNKLNPLAARRNVSRLAKMARKRA